MRWNDWSYTKRQIAQKGSLLQTYSPNGVLLEQFPTWCSFLWELHAISKQTATCNGDFAAIRHVEGQTASGAGDFMWKGISPVQLATSPLLLKSQLWLASFGGAGDVKAEKKKETLATCTGEFRGRGAGDVQDVGAGCFLTGEDALRICFGGKLAQTRTHQ